MSAVEAEGRCLCGAVTIAVTGAPLRMAQCHCLDCQRITGTGHATNALFAETDVTIKGETGSYAAVADSGNIATRHFCSTCGSRVFGLNSARPGVVNVPVGVFEDSSWFKPQLALFNKRRQVWDAADPSVEQQDAGIAPAGLPK